jgi:hypothetical protein
MSVSIDVGVLARALEEDQDEELAARLRGQFDRIREVLRRNGSPLHREPEDTERAGNAGLGFDGVSNDDVRNLHGVYAYCVADLEVRRRALGAVMSDAVLAAEGVPRAVRAARGAYSDSLVDRVRAPDHHLLYHSPWEGFFVPVDFAEVLEDDELDGGSLGSSVRLFAELVRIAEPLGVALEGEALPIEEARRIRQAGVTDLGGGLHAIAPEHAARHAWLTFYEAARHSIEYGTAIALQ